MPPLGHLTFTFNLCVLVFVHVSMLGSSILPQSDVKDVGYVIASIPLLYQHDKV